MVKGYARVSTTDQDNTRQIEELQKHGCELIYQDKISGAKKARPELDRMLSELQPGDTVIVLKLDRLGRSLSHLIELIDRFKRQKVEFKSLGDPIDTTTATGRAFFQMMAVFAEFERGVISERVRHGMASKKANGSKFGRPKIDQSGLIEAIKERKSKGMKAKEIKAELNLTGPRYHRLINSQNGKDSNYGIIRL